MRISIVASLMMLLALVVTACSSKSNIEEPQNKEKLEVSIYLDVDGEIIPYLPSTRAVLKAPVNYQNAWTISGMGQYDYGERIGLRISRPRGASGATFNESNNYIVEYALFEYNSGYSGLPKTDIEARAWARGTEFKSLFDGTFRHVVKDHLKMIVKITKSTGVDVGGE